MKHGPLECCICLEPLDGTIVTIPCGPHAFHYACYHQWRSKTDACPLCRSVDRTIPLKDIVAEDIDDRCYSALSMGTYAAFAWITGVILGAYGCV